MEERTLDEMRAAVVAARQTRLAALRVRRSELVEKKQKLETEKPREKRYSSSRTIRAPKFFDELDDSPPPPPPRKVPRRSSEETKSTRVKIVVRKPKVEAREEPPIVDGVFLRNGITYGVKLDENAAKEAVKSALEIAESEAKAKNVVVAQNVDDGMDAEYEARCLTRINELKREGKWSGVAIPKNSLVNYTIPKALIEVPEENGPRAFGKTHRDFLLSEMAWLAKDFREEKARKLTEERRRAKACKKVVKAMIQRDNQREKEEEKDLRKIAGFMARSVKQFWGQINKIREYKLETRINMQKNEAFGKHLDFVVGQTERLSHLIAADLHDSGVVAPKNAIEIAAEEARDAIPTGKVRTPVPFLLRGTLREYQHVGLDWLATMYEKNLNVILADEMGLGKTIMTISLLAHLACEKQNWGPHLIIVPSSTVMNWEMEIRKFCPAFKILTYIGSPKERKEKRTGWNRENAMHICITSYRIALQDASLLRRKHWCYMILDEAQNIKNFKSQRWQGLLQYKSDHRLLLTGTPLQNSIMELWSLMHFLMPVVFASHAEFSEWFAVPLTQMIEQGSAQDAGLVSRLHSVLRPFLLRRVKKDVERNLPPKTEVIIPCKLSRRQQFLYEEFINAASTQETLQNGTFFGVVNVLMQLRKVCNHPDLFTPRPTESPFFMFEPLKVSIPSFMHLLPQYTDFSDKPERDRWVSDLIPTGLFGHTIIDNDINSPSDIFLEDVAVASRNAVEIVRKWKEHRIARFNEANTDPRVRNDPVSRIKRSIAHEVEIRRYDNIERRCMYRSLWALPRWGGEKLRDIVTLPKPEISLFEGISLQSAAKPWTELAPHYVFLHPKANAPRPVLQYTTPMHSLGFISQLDPHFDDTPANDMRTDILNEMMDETLGCLEPIEIRRTMHFPDKRLLQFDCGKLQELAILLRRLRNEGHKVVLFTQMSKVLDIIEAFANLHRLTYLRLDGSTKIEVRQILVERFNRDPKIFMFISTTRSGGCGINLTGADTVVFYDSDWNPSIDAQAQDRCHRIGQTRPVTIYRLVTEGTIEDNILKKARHKKALNRMVIKDGSFTTDFLSGLNLQSLIKQQNKDDGTKRAWLRSGEDVDEKELENALNDGEIDAAQEMETKDNEEEFAENDPVESEDLKQEAPATQEPEDADMNFEMPPQDNEMSILEALESELNPLQKYGLRVLDEHYPAEEEERMAELQAELKKFGAAEEQWDLTAMALGANPQNVIESSSEEEDDDESDGSDTESD